jgi:trafficking protein particle complex subunit 8
MPSQQRAGHLFVSGLTLGAGHSALKEIIEESERLKVKRSMYAETRKEKEDILDAIRASEWNVEMNPIVVNVSGGNERGHDFSKGYVTLFHHSLLSYGSYYRDCQVMIDFTLRNYSLTHPARYTLKLTSILEAQSPPA